MQNCTNLPLSLATFVVSALLALLPSSYAQDDSSGTLYILPQGTSLSRASGVLSGDGLTAGGTYFNNTDYTSGALLWNKDAGLVAIQEPSISGGNAYVLSFDGSVAGSAVGPYPYRWEKGSGSIALRNEEGNFFLGEIGAISDDGKVLAGVRNDGEGNNIPFTWTEENGTKALPIPIGYDHAAIHAASSDGSVIGGKVYVRDGFHQPGIWVDGEFRAIGENSTGNSLAVVSLSSDGSKALMSNPGGGIYSVGFLVDITSGGTVALPIGDCPLDMFYDPEDDFYAIIGFRTTSVGPGIFRRTAYLWEVDASGTVETINAEEILLGRLGLDPAEWNFRELISIAADGQTMTGTLENSNAPDGNFIYDANGKEGIIYMTFGNVQGQGERFAQMIEDSTVVEDWVLGSWLDVFWAGIYASEEWVYHSGFEWLYVPALPELTTGYWFYSNKLVDWIYTIEDSYPWIYLTSQNEWVYQF